MGAAKLAAVYWCSSPFLYQPPHNKHQSTPFPVNARQQERFDELGKIFDKSNSSNDLKIEGKTIKQGPESNNSRKSPERAAQITSMAEIYGISTTTVYRALRQFNAPRTVGCSDQGKPRVLPTAELARYCELIAALKLRTTNKKGRHVSTPLPQAAMNCTAIFRTSSTNLTCRSCHRTLSCNRRVASWWQKRTGMPLRLNRRRERNIALAHNIFMRFGQKAWGRQRAAYGLSNLHSLFNIIYIMRTKITIRGIWLSSTVIGLHWPWSKIHVASQPHALI